MTSLHIVLPFPLGDQVVFTGVMRELRRVCPPRQLPITLDAPVPEVWRHNPNVILRRRVDTGHVVEIDGQYSAGANVRGRHMAYGFAEVLSRVVGIPIPVSDICGEIFLSREERLRPSPAAEAMGEELPYWVICNGGKFDRTVKWWPDEHYQEVVRALKGRVQFVQVGGRRHYHPRLEGALDLRGWTDVRSLIRLIHRAEGVICPITGLMHLAASVPRSDGNGAPRPCVVIGGGIEPAHWSVYPGQLFHSTVGALECTGLGCWKSRTRTLGDGAHQDETEARCVAVKDGFPQCMRMISPEQVVASVEAYLDSGACSKLTRRQWRIARATSGLLRGEALDASSVSPLTLGLAMDRWVGSYRMPRWMAFGSESSGDSVGRGFRADERSCDIGSVAAGPSGNGGLSVATRGIVTGVSGNAGALSAWVLVRLLRQLRCELPVEVWADEKAGDALGRLVPVLRRLRCRVRRDPSVPGRGGPLFPEADWIRRSRFREVLWLRSGCYPITDPTPVFECEFYRGTGLVLWPGLETSSTTPLPLWGVFGIERQMALESAPGLMLVDRARADRALGLLAWCDRNRASFRGLRVESGDFARLACLKTGTSYHVVGRVAVSREGCWDRTTGQGLPSFCDRVDCEFAEGYPRRWVGWFPHERECQAYVDEFRARTGGRAVGDGAARSVASDRRPPG